jgi:hypothetical protein
MLDVVTNSTVIWPKLRGTVPILVQIKADGVVNAEAAGDVPLGIFLDRGRSHAGGSDAWGPRLCPNQHRYSRPRKQ